MTDFIDFLNSHTKFFEDDARYVINEYGQNYQDISIYTMKHDNFDLVFTDLYPKATSDWSCDDKEIRLSGFIVEEIITDSESRRSYSDYYILDRGVLSLGEKEVTLNVIPIEGDYPGEFSSIIITRISSRDLELVE